MDENQEGQQAEPTEDQPVSAEVQPNDQADGLLSDGASEDENAGKGEGENADSENDESTVTVPDEYAPYEMREGVEVDESLVALANPRFKELGLSQEQAQGVADIQADVMQMQVDQFNQQVQSWKEEAKSHPEFGGEKYDENLGDAKKAFDAYFSKDLLSVLNSTGLSSHPELLTGLMKMGRELKSDNPGGGGNPPSKEKSRVETLYPND